MELWGAVRWEIFARGERLDKGRRGMGPVRGRGMGPGGAWEGHEV